jgi:hypothetical protein
LVRPWATRSPSCSTCAGRTVLTVAIQDLETIYDAQGQAVGKIAIHAVSHVTYTDLNLNGQPDDGEVEVQFDRFRLRCA